MHECPVCGQMCDCDGEDLFHSIPPDDCDCACKDEEEEWNDDDWQEYASEELENFGCVLGDACIMPGLHFPSECHTSADLEEQYAAEQVHEPERERRA